MDMRRKALVVGAVALVAVLAGGWALAQTAGQGPMGFGPPFMRGHGPDGMGPGMMKGMRHGSGMMGMEHGAGMMKGHGMMKGMGPGMMHGQDGTGLADPAQLETLKTELKITASQEQAWSKYAKTVQDAAASMKTARAGVDPEAVRKMSPADRYAFVSKMREQAQERFAAIRAAADELLATLDATQKARANDILPGLAFNRGPMRGAFAGEHKH
jgi:hypothetical protein